MRHGALLLTLALAASLLALPAAAEPSFGIRISPERPTSADTLQIEVTVWTLLNAKGSSNLAFRGLIGNRLRFEHSYESCVCGGAQLWTIEVPVGPLEAGIYTVEVEGFTNIDTTFLSTLFAKTFEVVEAGDELVLDPAPDSGFSFTVSIDFEFPSGSGLHKTAHGVPLTRESGYFWLFEKDNAEVTVKILDGRPVNGRYWVFLSSMTDLKFTATVTQCPTNPQVGAPCFSKTYQSTQGVNQNIIDTGSWGPEGDRL